MVHRQHDGAVADQALRDRWRHARAGQPRDERAPKCVKIDDVPRGVLRRQHGCRRCGTPAPAGTTGRRRRGTGTVLRPGFSAALYRVWPWPRHNRNDFEQPPIGQGVGEVAYGPKVGTVVQTVPREQRLGDSDMHPCILLGDHPKATGEKNTHRNRIENRENRWFHVPCHAIIYLGLSMICSGSDD